MSTVAEKRTELAAMYYRRGILDETLERVITRLYEAWDSLPDAEKTLIDQKRQALAQSLQSTANAIERGSQIIAFLQFIESLDEALDVAYEQLLQGKSKDVFRSVGSLDESVADHMADLLRRPPADFMPRMASISKGIDFEEALEAVGGDESLESRETLEETTSEIGGEAKGIDEAPGGEEKSFYTQVDFPPAIENDTEKEHTLIIQLVLDKPVSTETRVEGEVPITFVSDEPELVEIKVTAPGFAERTGVWHRTIAVYKTENSQPAIFLLKLTDPSMQDRFIIVDFYHKGRNVGSFVFKTQVTSRMFVHSQASTRSATGGTNGRTSDSTATNGNADAPVPPPIRGSALVERAVSGLRLPVGPPPPVDVELRITRVDERTLHFTLHSSRGHMGYHWRSVGSVSLDGLRDPEGFLDGIHTQLNQLARKPIKNLSADEIKFAVADIENIGMDLYDQLFPDALKDEYWRLIELRDKIKEEKKREMTLLITSDEPWIPWELVRPYTATKESDFLAGAFQLSRWLAGRGPMEELSIRAVRLVAPRTDLDFVKTEIAYFKKLAERGIETSDPILTYSDFLDLARRGGVQVVHVATHGEFDVENINESPIVLQDRSLIPQDINSRRAAGFVAEKPIVFFNTCHSGRMGLDLTRPGGWAQRMVDEVGVTAFVGSHWEIHDELAAIFSSTFYSGLIDGKTLGQAFHDARMAVRDQQPANPTWLAYVLYGDPNSTIEWTGNPSG